MKALSATLLFLLIQLAPSATAAPNPPSRPRAASSEPISINLLRKRFGPSTPDSDEAWGKWAKSQKETLQNKYSGPNSKRSSGTNL